MTRVSALSIFIIFSILVSSCNALAPQPTVTPTYTNTRLPSATSTLTDTPTYTLQPTESPTLIPSFTNTPELLAYTPTQEGLPEQPQGTPVGQWRGIPIMPGAIAGEESSSSYQYIISQSPASVQSYYERELAGLGWLLMAVGTNEKNATVLVFIQGFNGVSISISLLETGNTYVLILQT